MNNIKYDLKLNGELDLESLYMRDYKLYNYKSIG